MPYQAVTLAQFRQQLKDKWESVPFWTDADALLAINESLRIWNLLTGYWKRKAPITTVANQVWYQVGSTLLYGLRGEWQGLPVTYNSVFDMDYGHPGWEKETTASGGNIPNRVVHVIPKGLTLFAIWPADAVGGNSLLVDSVRATPTLVNDTDYIDIGQEEFGALLGFALHIAAFKQGGLRWKSTQHYYQEFIVAALSKNERLKASIFYRKYLGLDTGKMSRVSRIPVDPNKFVQTKEA